MRSITHYRLLVMAASVAWKHLVVIEISPPGESAKWLSDAINGLPDKHLWPSALTTGQSALIFTTIITFVNMCLGRLVPVSSNYFYSSSSTELSVCVYSWRRQSGPPVVTAGSVQSFVAPVSASSEGWKGDQCKTEHFDGDRVEVEVVLRAADQRPCGRSSKSEFVSAN